MSALQGPVGLPRLLRLARGAARRAPPRARGPAMSASAPERPEWPSCRARARPRARPGPAVPRAATTRTGCAPAQEARHLVRAGARWPKARCAAPGRSSRSSRRSRLSARCAPRLLPASACTSSTMTVVHACAASRAPCDVSMRYSDSGVVMRMSGGLRWMARGAGRAWCRPCACPCAPGTRRRPAAASRSRYARERLPAGCVPRPRPAP